jgi:hypothetical protein
MLWLVPPRPEASLKNVRSNGTNANLSIMEVVIVRVRQLLEAVGILSIGLRHVAAKSNADWRYVQEEHFRLFVFGQVSNLTGYPRCPEGLFKACSRGQRPGHLVPHPRPLLERKSDGKHTVWPSSFLPAVDTGTMISNEGTEEIQLTSTITSSASDPGSLCPRILAG